MKKSAHDYLTHTMQDIYMTKWKTYVILHFRSAGAEKRRSRTEKSKEQTQ